jgi:hypothetical protein
MASDCKYAALTGSGWGCVEGEWGGGGGGAHTVNEASTSWALVRWMKGRSLQQTSKGQDKNNKTFYLKPGGRHAGGAEPRKGLNVEGRRADG